MNWTGTQWSVGFFVPVTIGLITAGDTVLRTFSDPRLIRTLEPTQNVSLAARWNVQAPADFPIIVYADLVDAALGEVDLLLFNPFTVDTDFVDRDCYFEVSLPFFVP